MSDDNNKLADLNNMLKNNSFNIKEDDEQDFAVFLKQLQDKRGKPSVVEKKKEGLLESILADQYNRYDERNDDDHLQSEKISARHDEFDSHKFDKVAENIDRV